MSASINNAEVQQQFPQFDDELKKIREDYASEYEKKMKREFAQIDEIKKDIWSKQEVYETQ